MRNNERKVFFLLNPRCIYLSCIHIIKQTWSKSVWCRDYIYSTRCKECSNFFCQQSVVVWQFRRLFFSNSHFLCLFCRCFCWFLCFFNFCFEDSRQCGIFVDFSVHWRDFNDFSLSNQCLCLTESLCFCLVQTKLFLFFFAILHKTLRHIITWITPHQTQTHRLENPILLVWRHQQCSLTGLIPVETQSKTLVSNKHDISTQRTNFDNLPLAESKRARKKQKKSNVTLCYQFEYWTWKMLEDSLASGWFVCAAFSCVIKLENCHITNGLKELNGGPASVIIMRDSYALRMFTLFPMGSHCDTSSNFPKLVIRIVW